MDWDIPYTSTTFTAYLGRAHEKLVYTQELTETDELVLEVASVIMEMHEKIQELEGTLHDVNIEMDKIETLAKELCLAQN